MAPSSLLILFFSVFFGSAANEVPAFLSHVAVPRSSKGLSRSVFLMVHLFACVDHGHIYLRIAHESCVLAVVAI